MQTPAARLRAVLLTPAVLWASGAAFVIIHVWFFGFAIPSLNSLVPGETILDSRLPGAAGQGLFSWTGATVEPLFTGLGKAGRAEYLRFALLDDMIFSVVISPIFFMALLVRLYPGQVFWFGVFTGVFDTLENAAIATLLISHPEASVWATEFGPYFSVLKLTGMALTFAMIVIGTVFWLGKRFLKSS